MPFTKLDEARSAHYDRLERIYRGQHAGVFDFGDSDEQFPPVIVNYSNAIIDGLSGLVASSSPKFTLGTAVAQNKIDEVIEASAFGTELLQFVTQGLLYGDSLMKVFRDADGQTQIRCLSPKRWIATPDPDDADTILEHTLFSVRKLNDMKLVRQESHTAGFIVFSYWNATGGTLVEISPEKAFALVPEWTTEDTVVETGVNEPLVISWSHDKLCGDAYGTSELMPIMDLIRALDMRATQEDRVLTKHADPRIILEEGTFDRDSDGNVVIKDIDIIMVPQGSDKEKLGYLTWDGKLEAVDKQIDRLVEQQLHITQVSRLLLNADKTQAQTGEAFKVQLFPSILKAEHIQMELMKPILTTVRVAQKLSGTSGGRSFTPATVRVDWGVDLPQNMQSQVQAEVQKVDSGIQTPEEARRNLDDNKKL